MKIVGLTGGIGSGKTTIAKMFGSLGVPIYFADDEAKNLMNTSTKIKNKLIGEFGEDAYINGKLNRLFLADLIFNDKEKLLKINKIVHPEVDHHFKNWVKNQNSTYVIQENAIIFENDNQNNFDEIITVTAPKIDKINRVIARDNSTKTKVLKRMNNQLSDKFKITNSKYVIYNIDLEQSELQVQQIHTELLQ